MKRRLPFAGFPLLVRTVWVVFAVAIGTNLAGYYSGASPIAGYIILSGIAFFAVVQRGQFDRFLTIDLACWVFFIGTPIVLMALSERSFSRGVWTSEISLLLIFLTSSLVARDRELREFAGRAAVCVVIVATAADLYELFVEANVWSIAPGRSAGFYTNPNVSSACLVGYAALFLITRAGDLDWRDYAVMGLVFLGVASTFSRSGVLLMFLVFGVCYYMRMRTIAVSFLYAVLLFVILITIFLVYILPTVGLSDDAEHRLTSLLGGTAKADFEEERAGIARYAWGLFLQNPLTGVGVRSSLMMESGHGPHNTYISLAMDMGVFSLIAFVVLLGRMLWRGWRRTALESRHAAFAVPLFVWLFFYSFFTHDVLYDSHGIMLIAFAVSWPEADATNRRGLRA